MKKAKSLILLGASLLLTSCSSYDEEALINESKRDLASLQETTKTKYTVSCEGHVLEYKEFYQADREFDVPTGEVINSTALVGESYLLKAPVRIKEESYISEDAATNATCSLNKIKVCITGMSDNIHFLEYQKEGDNLVFFTKNVSKDMSFYNLVVPNGPSKPKPVSCYARYNFTLTYNSEGLLVSEEVKTKNAGKEAEDRTIDAKITYSYR